MSVLTDYPNFALFCFLPPSNSIEVGFTSLADVDDPLNFDCDQEVIVHWPTRSTKGKKTKKYAANVLLFGDDPLELRQVLKQYCENKISIQDIEGMRDERGVLIKSSKLFQASGPRSRVLPLKLRDQEEAITLPSKGKQLKKLAPAKKLHQKQVNRQLMDEVDEAKAAEELGGKDSSEKENEDFVQPTPPKKRAVEEKASFHSIPNHLAALKSPSMDVTTKNGGDHGNSVAPSTSNGSPSSSQRQAEKMRRIDGGLLTRTAESSVTLPASRQMELSKQALTVPSTSSGHVSQPTKRHVELAKMDDESDEDDADEPSLDSPASDLNSTWSSVPPSRNKEILPSPEAASVLPGSSGQESQSGVIAALKQKVKYYEDVMEVRNLVNEIRYLRTLAREFREGEQHTGGSGHIARSSSPRVSFPQLEPTPNHMPEEEDGLVSEHLNDDQENTDILPSKFPISKVILATYPRNLKMSLFVGRLMDYLYTPEYMAGHTMTTKAATVGAGAKLPMNPTELQEIIDVTKERYPVTIANPELRRAAELRLEGAIRKTIGSKLNNMATKMGKTFN